MSVLPKYQQGGQARFSFRIANGLGSFCEPDWEEPDLRVEFYDGAGGLKFTATKTNSPALAAAGDAQGAFLYVEGIELSDFSLGICDAHIYGKVNGEQVFPYPTVLEAFEVIAGTGAEPVYSITEKVKAELPSELPSQLTDSIIAQYLHDASRRIDAALAESYPTPFPGIEQDPATPAMIERLCRKLAIADCLIFMGTANEMEIKPLLEERAMAELERLRKGELALPHYEAPLSVYQGAIYREEYPGDTLD
jgi:phage gp36-like protein